MNPPRKGICNQKKGQDPKACIWWCSAATRGLPALTPESNTSTLSIWMTSVPQHEVEDAVKFTHAIPQGLQLVARGHAWCDRPAPPNVKSDELCAVRYFCQRASASSNSLTCSSTVKGFPVGPVASDPDANFSPGSERSAPT